ncbi:MAG TPA: FMN-dependent NADH-azoreductase [Rudaea sp.]|jgi:FMN-dependent NADH-azoreductase|uniref:FMN-dependent NADH-azoreductase n=1 Tax=Rudaea sp. TaxID=2136325 RepID=UPI002F950DAB
MKLLHIDSSVLGTHSASRELSATVVKTWQQRHPGGGVVYRDLAREPLAHFSAEVLGARMNPDAQLSAEQRHDVDAGNRALDEFLAADVIVIGTPMYNFSVPSQLKAWIDRILVAGTTFKYSANGVEGLAKGKKVIVVSARGGFYSAESPMASFDFQESYLRKVFAFAGISDIEFVRAEGLNISPEQRGKSIESAHHAIQSELLAA